MYIHSNVIEVLFIGNNSNVNEIIEVFNEFQNKCNLTIAADIAEIIDDINRNYRDRIYPSIIILDLPKEGIKTIKKIKKDKNLKYIPVIILTTSSTEEDVKNYYCNYASAYLTKPDNINEYKKLIRSFANFWFKWPELPKFRLNF